MPHFLPNEQNSAKLHQLGKFGPKTLPACNFCNSLELAPSGPFLLAPAPHDQGQGLKTMGVL